MGIARPALLAAALALAACGDVNVKRLDNDFEEWSHPTKDALDIRGERADCERFHGSTRSEIDNCLKAKGWKQRESKGLF
jgi:hypothetical protein